MLNNVNEIDGEKSWILNVINEQFGLFSVFLNHLITAEEFFHWLTPIEDEISLIIC